jgi:hypothetical protein
MVLAIYKKNKLKDKWHLYSVAKSVEEARKFSKVLKETAKKSGFEEADTIIQYFESPNDIREFIINPKPEKLLYN